MMKEKGKTKSEKASVLRSLCVGGWVSFVLFACSLCTSVATAETVGYWDPVGKVTKSADATVVTADTATLASGWYVVKGKVSRGSIAVNGDVHLILMDGCELTAKGSGGQVFGDGQAGVAVSPGNSLTIYGQTAGTGKLTATGSDFGAGIGGSSYVAGGSSYGAGGTVTINGGTVTATGGWHGAGIGGGADYGAGGTVTINGGTVTATGGDFAAGIGGGDRGAGGVVTISDGWLDVKAGKKASVIGAGYEGGSQGTVTILGGIFSWKPNDEWLVDQEVVPVVANPDAATCEKYPWAVDPTGASFVSFGKSLEHMTAAWTSGDGSVSKPIGREFFAVPKGATDVKVIFTPEERYWLDKTEYVFAGAINEDCMIPAEDLPTATWFYAVVTVGQLNHMTAAWTSGDGTVTNAISGTSFEVLKGTTGVKIVFTPEQDYRFTEVGETGIRELDSPLEMDCEVTPPQVEWNVGDAVTAHVSDDGTLVITGTGAMDDFASAADAPWHGLASEISAVTVADGVTHIGKNAFAGFADTVKVNGIPSSFYRMMGGAYGMSSGQFPSGAISAGFESINIVDGTAYLGVAVKTNVNLTAEAKSWGKVGLEAKDVTVENGSVIIAVPANTEQGFMVLESSAAK